MQEKPARTVKVLAIVATMARTRVRRFWFATLLHQKVLRRPSCCCCRHRHRIGKNWPVCGKIHVIFFKLVRTLSIYR